ncbi:MAG: YafY family transcriptional regulator [Brevundimonas sp.]|uniref:helix-turn-helix transcriptional regulator n=1 Tax=Brevundimonas sp. TaxID=1871086 RepID=UPI0011F42803|nr:YafY family protein [Brevundimonas sp.]RZJ18998.1 MAG: YafY family transcriptional regulator [Brevundimonas sp.]
MRASRLLSILLMLQTRGRLTAETLAAEFEVSVRTIYRDIDQLSAAGAPVYADRGRSGGFQLLDGYRTRLTGLTDAEAETLFLGGLAGPAAQMGFSEAVGAMQLKLLAALPPERQAAAERIAGRFHLDPIGWFQTAEEAHRLPAIAQAVWTCRRIKVLYESWNGRRERMLEPLGLILKAGRWYLAAMTAGGEVGVAPRTYRISNALELTVSEEVFERPDSFDLPAWWAETSQRFERERFTQHARLRLNARGLKYLAMFGAEYARLAGAATPGADGWVEVDAPFETVAWAASEFMRLGDDAEVLAPPELREAVVEACRRTLAVYQPISLPLEGEGF